MIMISVLFLLVIITAMTGLVWLMVKKGNAFKKSSLIIAGLLAVFVLSAGFIALSVNKVYSQEKTAEVQEVKAPSSGSAGFGLIAAGIAVGLGSIGAGIAVGMAAAAAIGAISENPKMFGNAIVFVGLAEGIAIYGLVIAIMVLNK